MESARRAEAGDLDAVHAVVDTAVADLRQRRGGARLTTDIEAAARVVGEWTAHLADVDRLVVVGEIDRVVVGLAIAHLERRTGSPHAMVDVLYVEPGGRGVGVAEAMMNVVVDWCEQAGCDGVDAAALPGSREAKAFFETHGFVTRLLVMHRPLDGRR